MTRAMKISAYVAMGLLMAASTAAAQKKASTITSGGEITYRTQSQDQTEFGPTGSISSKWTEYRTMRNGTSIPSLKLWSTGGKVDFNLSAYNVQQKDQQYLGSLNAYGLGLKFNWNEIPHAMGNDARTIFTNTTPGVWTMSSTLRQALQAAVDLPGSGAATASNYIRFLPNYQSLLSPTFATADLMGIDGQRRTGNVELSLGKHLPFDVTFMYRNELKKGYRGQAGINENFRISPALQVGGPMDEETNDIGVRVAKTFDKGNAYVTINRNQYQNKIEQLIIDYPFQAADMPVTAASGSGTSAIGVTGGPSKEQAVMAPDNSANSLTAGFQLKFQRQTRLNVGIAMSERKQDALFYGYTAYSLATTTAMPRNSLDGKTNTTMLNVSFSSKPLTGVTVRAAYRKYDMEDKTDRFTTPGEFLGTAWAAAPAVSADAPHGFATNSGYDTKSSRLSASVSYDYKALTLEASGRSTSLERTFREAEKGTDKGMGLTAIYHFNDWLGFRGMYDKNTRTAEGTTVYGYQADEAPFTNTRIGGDLELSLPHGLEVSAGYIKRKVDYTDRPNRCYVVSGACATTTAVTTPIPNSPVGLLGTSYDSYTGQIDWTANDRLELGAYMTYEKDAQTNQWSSNPSAATYNLVNYAGSNKTNTYGGHATLQVIPEKATLMVNGLSQKVDGFMGITAPNAAGSFNTARAGFTPSGAQSVDDWDDTQITTVTAQLDYSLTKTWTFGLGYLFEKYDYKDPYVVLNNELLPSATIFEMKPNDGKYTAGQVYAKLTVKF